jgi:hypothetical protein
MLRLDSCRLGLRLCIPIVFPRQVNDYAVEHYVSYGGKTCCYAMASIMCSRCQVDDHEFYGCSSFHIFVGVSCVKSDSVNNVFWYVDFGRRGWMNRSFRRNFPATAAASLAVLSSFIDSFHSLINLPPHQSRSSS